jgi:hypothetical protein
MHSSSVEWPQQIRSLQIRHPGASSDIREDICSTTMTFQAASFNDHILFINSRRVKGKVGYNLNSKKAFY